MTIGYLRNCWFWLADVPFAVRCRAFTARNAGAFRRSCTGWYDSIRDLSVACDPPQFADAQVDTLTNPTLLIEILSPSTESYDRGQKARLYRAIPSLRELLLISQESFDVELYRRQEGGSWALYEVSGLDASIELAVRRLHARSWR